MGSDIFLRSHRQGNENAWPGDALLMYFTLRDNVLFGGPGFETSLTAAETTTSQDEDTYGDSLSDSFDLSRLRPGIFTCLCKSRMPIRVRFLIC